MPYGSIVPVQFHNLSAFGSHKFRISNIWWRPYRFYWNNEGIPQEFPRAFLCQIEIDGKTLDCLFPEVKAPNIFESLHLLSKAYGAVTRAEKFLNSFRALESLGEKAPIEIRSIRHTLAHSTTKLSDPKVLTALETMFGGVSINLRKHSHRREFFRNLGELLVIVDLKLANELQSNQDKWLSIDKSFLLAPFQEIDLGLDCL